MREQIDAVARMQEYIENNLDKNITLDSLSKVSNYSPWYSYRLFVKHVNLTPADYIRRSKLGKSALKLRDENIKIIDIAYEFGFDSVDGYQRAFYREFGCNPREYAASPIPIYLFIPYKVVHSNNEREKNMDNVKNVFIQVVERTERKVLIKRGIKATDYFEYCEEVGCDIFGLLTSIKSISGEPVSLWLPKKYIKEGTSEYVQGVEVSTDYDGVILEGLDVIELPKCKYLMFQGEPFKEEDYCIAIEQIWDAIKKYDPSVINYEWDDNNPRIQLEPIGTRGYIELVAVKEKK
jgi:AraC-like DNA-binding protein